MTLSIDLMEDFGVAEKKIDRLIPGKVYEFSYQRDDKTISKTFYILSEEKDSWRVLEENKFSDWSDFESLVTRESSRKIKPEQDIRSMAGKTIRELGIRDSKTFVKNCLKSFAVRQKFDIPPATRKDSKGKKVNITT